MSEDLYTTAFVSHDFVEGDSVPRAEVFVVMGRGRVDELIPSDSGKSQQIVIDTGKIFKNKPLKSKGWAPVDSSILKKAQEALDNDTLVDFRIETVRNKNVDRSIPIETLKTGMENARENVIHSVARIKLVNEEEWTNGIMRTNPKEDVRKTGRSALDLSDDEISAEKSSSTSNNSYSSMFEPPAWVTRNKNGEVHPGATAVSVPLTFYSFISKWERDKNITVKQKFAVTEALVKASNELQMGIYSNFEEPLTKPDLSLGSHTRARALVFDVIETFYPVTEDISSNLDEWVNNIVEKGLKMWKWGIKQVNEIDS